MELYLRRFHWLSVLFLVACLHTGQAHAQLAPEVYYVQFTDKANTPYSLTQPLDFLSQRSVQRRFSQNIPLNTNDLPVDPAYVQALRDAGNVTVRYTTRWLNGAVIYTTDSLALDTIRSLPFVDVGNSSLKRSGKRNGSVQKDLEPPVRAGAVRSGRSDSTYYGDAWRQIEMMQLHVLHDAGFRGRGVRIAVMDAGFPGVDSLQAFQDLRSEQRIVDTYDFVEGDSFVWRSSPHGTAVLSCMAAYQPGLIIGSAPDAEYLLFRTEDVASETWLEELNWIAAAERADSAGADILNTSLGYTLFDDPAQNHEYTDMNGTTTFISRGATHAASTGMLVVNSAGNYGDDPWFYIGAPADPATVLSVGSVTDAFWVSGFTSRGPNADGVIKPNVSAMGEGVAVILNDLTTRNATGTSFSAPLVAGGAACLWEADPTRTAVELFAAIEASAQFYPFANNDRGYGVPNFSAALWSTTGVPEEEDASSTGLYPNPARNMVHIRAGEPQQLYIYNALGAEYWSGFVAVETSLDVSAWPTGTYLLRSEDGNLNRTWIKVD